MRNLGAFAEVGAGLVAFVSACVVTWVVWRLGRRWRLMDRPNERSSHRQPMPTAGGMGIVTGFWMGMGLLLVMGGGDPLCRESVRSWGGGTAILLVMTCDDWVRPLRVAEKMLLLCLAAGVWLVWGVPLAGTILPVIGPVDLGIWGWGLTAFWFLALCNAYNFMDGIDGIVAVQTLSVSFFTLLCLWRLEGCWVEALLLSGAMAGFLVFNLPPARIFMGDVGATFTGFILAGLGVLGERAGLPLWVFAVFTGYFLFDTGYTLVRRALRGENVLRAHRKHLYQRLSKLGWSHRQIDLWVLCVNMVLGSGGYAYMFVSQSWGGLLMAVGAGLLVAEVVWIEREDRCFV